MSKLQQGNINSIQIISDIESKTERGYREILSSGVNAPSDGMIEFQLKVAEGEYVTLWATCERARVFCDMLHDMLRHHEEMGPRNTYPPREKVRNY